MEFSAITIFAKGSILDVLNTPLDSVAQKYVLENQRKISGIQIIIPVTESFLNKVACAELVDFLKKDVIAKVFLESF